MKKLGKRLNVAKETVETYSPCTISACKSLCEKYGHLGVDSYGQGKYLLYDLLVH